MCKLELCEIWRSFSRAPTRNFLRCYYRWLITSLALEKCNFSQYVCNDGYFTGFKQPQDANNDDHNNQGNENLPPRQSLDIEDIAGKQPSSAGRPVATKRKRGQMSLEKSLSKGNSSNQSDGQLSELSKSWKEVLGEPPKWGPNKV